MVNEAAKGNDVEGFSLQVNNFVQYGYVDNNAPSYLSQFRPAYKEQSKQHLLDRYKKLLSVYKTNKEQNGCTFRDHTIKTDEASQAKITGSLMMMNTGAIDTINFKSATGWLQLNKEEFTQLAITVATHVQVCFSVESGLMETLKTKSFEELYNLDPEATQSIANFTDNKNKKTIYDLYEEQYSNYFKSAVTAQSRKGK